MRDIPGYEGRYAVTDDGRVWSHPKPASGALSNSGAMRRGRWLSLIKSRGYRVVPLGAHNLQQVHRLVAETYLPRIPGRAHINHKNGNKADNRVENLEWVTQAENNRHAWRAGLVKPNRKITGEQVAEVHRMKASGQSRDRIAAHFGVGKSTIQRVLQGTHGY